MIIKLNENVFSSDMNQRGSAEIVSSVGTVKKIASLKNKGINALFDVFKDDLDLLEELQNSTKQQIKLIKEKILKSKTLERLNE
jgi:glycerate kinase